MNREIIARSPSGHVVTEDALLVQRVRRAIRQRDLPGDVVVAIPLRGRAGAPAGPSPFRSWAKPPIAIAGGR